jgi:cytoskeletal protein CcmA (bactofilin family)
MFSDRKRPEPAQAVHTLLGKDTLWKGEIITGTNNLRIEGTVEGTITSEGEVTIAPTGIVRGTILAKHLIVTGRVEGVFKIVECLEIHGTGCVEGEVELGSLVVDEGGTLQGTCTRRGVTRTSASPAAEPLTPAAAALANGALPLPGLGARNLEPVPDRHGFPAANGATADAFAKAKGKA